MKKLKVGLLISETANFPFVAFLPLLRACWPLYIAIGIAFLPGIPAVWAMLVKTQPMIKTFQTEILWVTTIVYYACGAIIFASAIRLAAQVEKTESKPATIRFGRAEVYCALSTIALYLASLALWLLLGFGTFQFLQAFSLHINSWLVFVPAAGIGIFILSLFSRFSILPAMGAMGLFPNPLVAWQITKGNQKEFIILSIVAVAGTFALLLVFSTGLFIFVEAFFGKESLSTPTTFITLTALPAILMNYLFVSLAAGLAGSLFRHLYPQPDSNPVSISADGSQKMN